MVTENNKSLLLSFDIETTGLSEDSTILSIGAVRYDNLDHFYAEIIHPSGAYCEPNAFKINKFNISDLQRKSNLNSEVGPLIGTLAEIDGLFSKWLFEIENNIILLGKNVLTFDARYTKKYLPKSYEIFSKHHNYCKVVEINGFINAISIYCEKDFKTLKEKAIVHSENEIKKMKLGLSAHNALYDAHEAIFIYEYLCMNYLKKKNKKSNSNKYLMHSKCLYCGKEFERKRHSHLDKIMPFCCIEHKKLYNIEEIYCLNCKTEIVCKKYNKRKFCSQECYHKYKGE